MHCTRRLFVGTSSYPHNAPPHRRAHSWQVVSGTFPPLAYVTVADVPTGAGFIYQHTLAFSAGNLNTLEGCYRAMTPYGTPYPGQLLSSGTEASGGGGVSCVHGTLGYLLCCMPARAAC